MTWLRRRRDLVLAVAITVAAELEIVLLDVDPKAAAVPMALVAGAALSMRRRAPVAAAVGCVAAVVVDTYAGVPQNEPTVPLVWLLVAMYSVARYPRLPRATAALAVALGLFGLTLAVDDSDLVFGLIILGAPWLVGRAMRATATEARLQAGRADQLEAARESEVRAAAAQERTRIARELHDVISHSVTAMVVQAGAAAEVAGRDSGAAVGAMETVQNVGRQALQELATLLGVLRASEHDEIGLAPQPRLSDLAQLLADARATGLPVDLRVEGESRPLSAGVELGLFRLVQECLTNVRKHARDASVCVTLRYADDDVVVEVKDDGVAAQHSSPGGHGIAGMRERIALLGGEVTAGALQPRGFRVSARIPAGRT